VPHKQQEDPQEIVRTLIFVRKEASRPKTLESVEQKSSVSFASVRKRFLSRCSGAKAEEAGLCQEVMVQPITSTGKLSCISRSRTLLSSVTQRTHDGPLF